MDQDGGGGGGVPMDSKHPLVMYKRRSSLKFEMKCNIFQLLLHGGLLGRCWVIVSLTSLRNVVPSFPKVCPLLLKQCQILIWSSGLVEVKSEGILCHPAVPHLQIRICHSAEECQREEDVHSTNSALWSLRQTFTGYVV